jgi:DNA-binding transcriptional regulator YhcF (GntR family)
MTSVSSLLAVPEVAKVQPPYRQIAEHYQARIRALSLKPGDPMPSIPEIAKEWRVATSTAGRAVALLRDEGWVNTAHGRTTYVSPSPPP